LTTHGCLLDQDFPYLGYLASQAWRRSLEYLTNLSSTGLREDLVTVNLASAAFAAGRRHRGYPVVRVIPK
jgi:hypothetical protein